MTVAALLSESIGQRRGASWYIFHFLLMIYHYNGSCNDKNNSV